MPQRILRPASGSLPLLEAHVERLRRDLDDASEPRDVAALTKALLDTLRARDEALAAAPPEVDPVVELRRRRSG